eukprot:COSAG01_NODE_4532_length_4948_cov_3.063724_2_plen_183_part_00
MRAGETVAAARAGGPGQGLLLALALALVLAPSASRATAATPGAETAAPEPAPEKLDHSKRHVVDGSGNVVKAHPPVLTANELKINSARDSLLDEGHEFLKTRKVYDAVEKYTAAYKLQPNIWRTNFYLGIGKEAEYNLNREKYEPLIEAVDAYSRSWCARTNHGHPPHHGHPHPARRFSPVS